ncbi:MAG: alpha-isopropylmalate synthase regulatory domain-containing protein, partial [Clostridia bacterium]|nr:alpha-isopropylmalate synthase regulatory domain-containing protein [Clostridia bacterium]
FMKNYVNIEDRLAVKEAHFDRTDGMTAAVTVVLDGKESTVSAPGNGRLDAVSNAIKNVMGDIYVLETYTEHALEVNSTSKAASYVGIRDKENGKVFWGAGIDSDIIVSSMKALVSAINRMIK